MKRLKQRPRDYHIHYPGQYGTTEMGGLIRSFKTDDAVVLPGKAIHIFLDDICIHKPLNAHAWLARNAR